MVYKDGLYNGPEDRWTKLGTTIGQYVYKLKKDMFVSFLPYCLYGGI